VSCQQRLLDDIRIVEPGPQTSVPHCPHQDAQVGLEALEQFTEGLAVSEPGTLQCSLPLAKGHRYTPGAETEAGVTGIGTLGA